MKKFGLLIVFVGLGLAFLWPWAQLNFQNDVIKTVELSGLRENGSAEAILDLTRADNPVRVRFVARYKAHGSLPPIKIPVFAKISDQNGTLLGAIISFATNSGESGPEQPTQGASKPLNVIIQNDGPHALTLSFADNKNDGGIKRPDIELVVATFIRNAKPINDQYRVLGIIIAVLGFYLIFRSRRASKEKKTTRWGRGK